jgi:hypothetical protein
MADDPTEEMVKKEIAKARRIIQSDKHSEALRGLSDRFDKHFPDNSGNPGDDDAPSPPPPVPPKETPKRKGIWWNNELPD